MFELNLFMLLIVVIINSELFELLMDIMILGFASIQLSTLVCHILQQASLNNPKQNTRIQMNKYN
jgi:hypothetical protein